MTIPEWVKPATWGVVGGAAAAMIIGFNWGGWVTGGTAGQMAAERAKAAVVAAYTPVCVANAMDADAAQRAKLKAENSWSRGAFVEESGWLGNIDAAYRDAVAEACAPKVVESMKTGTASSSS